MARVSEDGLETSPALPLLNPSHLPHPLMAWEGTESFWLSHATSQGSHGSFLPLVPTPSSSSPHRFVKGSLSFGSNLPFLPQPTSHVICISADFAGLLLCLSPNSSGSSLSQSAPACPHQIPFTCHSMMALKGQSVLFCVYMCVACVCARMCMHACVGVCIYI